MNASAPSNSTSPSITAGAVHLSLHQDYSFDVSFGSATPSQVLTDASPPLGAGAGPDSEMLLAAAVANCLSASLAFALRKYKNEQLVMSATADTSLGRNADGRLRVEGVAVEIRLGARGYAYRMLDRALAQFEDFCVVTQSVRRAIPVSVRVVDADGILLNAE